MGQCISSKEENATTSVDVEDSDSGLEGIETRKLFLDKSMKLQALI